MAVDYLLGSHLYGASPRYQATSAAERKARRRTVGARREVIVSAGVFNSPQLLMLDSDPMAVLDARFRVRGTSKLRVVDASAFSTHPGTFHLGSGSHALGKGERRHQARYPVSR